MFRACLLFLVLLSFTFFSVYVWKPSFKELLTSLWKFAKIVLLVGGVTALTIMIISVIQ